MPTDRQNYCQYETIEWPTDHWGHVVFIASTLDSIHLLYVSFLLKT